MKTTFIYTLSDPRSGQIRYVGKADDPCYRLSCHMSDTKRRAYRINWIKSLKAQGLSPICDVVDEVPFSEWELWEREYIRLFRMLGMRLVNTTDGGEGATNPSAEARLKMSLARKGKPLSSETRAKLRAINLGKKLSPQNAERLRLVNLGRKNSPETIARMRATALKRFTKEEWRDYFVKRPKHAITPELREKLAAVQRGKKHSEATKAKMSAAKIGKPKSPETRERMRLASLGRTMSEEARRKMSMAAMGRKPTVEARLKMSAAQKRIQAAKRGSQF